MIRQLRLGDVDIFRRIRLESLQTDPQAFASTAKDWESLPEAEWARRMTANPVFVDFDGDEPVGIAGLLRHSAAKMAHRAHVIMVFVRPSHRGQGRAEALMDHARDHAKGMGLRMLELSVSAENPAAIRFYERMGFAEVGRIPAGYLVDGRETDELIMVQRLGA